MRLLSRTFASSPTMTALFALMLSLCITAPFAHAQDGLAGVSVDADGVLRRMAVQDRTGQLTNQRIAQAMQQLDRDLTKPSKLRKVSLTRLERAIEKKLAAGENPDNVMKHLAGLTRIDYVFCYPAEKGQPGDIVIAGPAEPWAKGEADRVRGIKSGAPVVELQDLVTALRLFPPRDSQANKAKSPQIYCSIDPTQEGLANFRTFMSQVRLTQPPNQQEVKHLTSAMQNSLGLQTITIGGVSPKTHFAHVLVEADYRMKLIGIGIEQPPVRLKSYVDRANPAMVSRNALQRWYFVPDYERLAVSDDGLAMQLVGEGVRLIGEDEFVNRDGTRTRKGRSNSASTGFTSSFTKMYSRLADRSPVYAQLRNCIDLAVAAAFIQDQQFYTQADWRAETLSDEAQVPVEVYNVPQQVATAVTSKWKGSTLMTPIGGGVQIRPTESLQSANIRADEGQIAAARENVKRSGDNWWWD